MTENTPDAIERRRRGHQAAQAAYAEGNGLPALTMLVNYAVDLEEENDKLRQAISCYFDTLWVEN